MKRGKTMPRSIFRNAPPKPYYDDKEALTLKLVPGGQPDSRRGSPPRKLVPLYRDLYSMTCQGGLLHGGTAAL